MKVAESRTLNRGTDRDLSRVSDRYWIKLLGSGYVSFSGVTTLQTDFFVSVDCKLVSGGAGADVLTSNGAYYWYVYNNDHATKPNAVEIKTTTETVTWVNAYPSDRSKGHTVRVEVVSGVATLFIDGAANTTTKSVTGQFRVGEAFFASVGCTYGNLNLNNQEYFSFADGSGSTPVSSIGSLTSSFVGSGQTWVSGRLDDQ